MHIAGQPISNKVGKNDRLRRVRTSGISFEEISLSVMFLLRVGNGRSGALQGFFKPHFEHLTWRLS
jgi:hypothetical protein